MCLGVVFEPFANFAKSLNRESIVFIKNPQTIVGYVGYKISPLKLL